MGVCEGTTLAGGTLQAGCAVCTWRCPASSIPPSPHLGALAAEARLPRAGRGALQPHVTRGHREHPGGPSAGACERGIGGKRVLTARQPESWGFRSPPVKKRKRSWCLDARPTHLVRGTPEVILATSSKET